MTLAYLISAHTDAPQLKRLVETLHPDAHFFIHIDKKSDITPFQALLPQDNVHFIQERIDVRWGTILEVEYQMALIKAAIDHPVTFDRIFFLSGMDYPLWSNDRITHWLEAQKGKEILSGICMDNPAISEQQRTLYSTARPFFRIGFISNQANQRLSIVCRKAKQLLGLRKSLSFPVGNATWHLYKGAAWWCISQSLAAYIYDTYMQQPVLRHYFTDSFGQAETLIQTIAFNSPQWAPKCILHQGEYPGLAALTPLHFIIYEPIIKVMDETDYDTLMASGRMFTRKLVSGKSDRLVELLTQRT
ncbi:MAG: beta-1,6-N-acetylglucosaminyltransferase [Bacteroidales bacterium]|nr:beta-1,6-N-acetylglucosaminyltransferase [Bacteroidales bacterium]